MGEQAKKLIVGSIIVVVAVIIGLVASSLKRLSSEEAGLKYDVVQRQLDDQLYLAGKHSSFISTLVPIFIYL